MEVILPERLQRGLTPKSTALHLALGF